MIMILVIGCVFCVFFNDTATNLISPYLHTLTLHDALPICSHGGNQPHADLAVALSRRGAERRPQGDCRPLPRSSRRRDEDLARHAWRDALDGRPFRSEEHTSELQSLMRISYAVFCLKKKKTRNRHTGTVENSCIIPAVDKENN